MLNFVMDIIVWLLASGKWSFKLVLSENPLVNKALEDAVKDGVLDNYEVAHIIMAIREEI
ncbi:hypothetical protein ES703_102449 [subsurface metagenome]